MNENLTLNNRTARGYASEEEAAAHAHLDTARLELLLDSTSALERTIAVRLLSKRIGIEDTAFTRRLLGMLEREKSLYTRMALCSALESGDTYTAAEMIPYLGKIGGNQHTFVPDAPSKKTSFPLPRDIIARSLGRMAPTILPLLQQEIAEEHPVRLPEAIDAFGYLISRNEPLMLEEHCDLIARILDWHQDDPLIVWKCLVCLSAFHLEYSEGFLQDFLRRESNPLLCAEASRSLALVQSKIYF